MSLADIVNVVITTQNPGITAAGFGIPLIASTSAAWVERTRTYNSITDVTGDFAATTVEWQTANTIFGQSPAPTTVMIGRCANHPTQVFDIAIATVVNTAGTHYKVRINDLSAGAAGAAAGVTADFVTVGADTNDSIIAGIKAAIDALAIAGVVTSITGAGGSHVLVLTMTANKWIGIEVYDVSPGAVGGLMLLSEVTADPGITADLNALVLDNINWYGLIISFKSAAIIAAAAAVVESATKLFIVSSADTLVATQAQGVGADIAQTLRGSSRARTGCAFHPRNDEFFDAAEMGRWFPIDPGGDNWRLKSLSGPSPAKLTSTQKTNVEAKYCNWYGTLNGQVNLVLGDGKVSANEYIDVIRFRDWWVANVQADLINVLIQNEKVPFTDGGTAMLELKVRSRNVDGQDAGGIARDPAPTYQTKAVKNVSSADKQARTFNGLTTQWVLAGAINKLKVTATVTA